MKNIPASSRTVTVGDKSIEQIEAEWRAWSAPLARKPDDVPPEWITALQYSKIIGTNKNHAKSLLDRGVSAGSAEKRMFKIADPSGRIREVAHYRIIK